jgi:flavin reductase (DIM6/NTAB) family NADH-FMN oxidoreductase RutF
MSVPEAQRQLVAALGRIPSGVFILTVRNQEAETGLLISFVQQCSFDPPLLTLALKRGRYVGNWIQQGAPFTINILDEAQSDMIGHFGRGFDAGEAAFEGIDLERRADRAPVLLESLSYLDCRLVACHPAGDHDLYLCEVVHGAMLSEGRPMVHVRKSGMHY